MLIPTIGNAAPMTTKKTQVIIFVDTEDVRKYSFIAST